MKWKASYTVEAALICPMLCLLICAMLSFTMSLYYRVETEEKAVIQKEVRLEAKELIRVERAVERLWQEE